MKRRRLGKSGLVVSEICLGTMTFGSMADERVSLEILDTAFEAGVDFLDASEVYPVPPRQEWAGRTEEIVGKWLAGKPRESVVIATKVAGPGGGWFVPPVRGGRTSLDAHHIERAVEASLRRLGTDYIDLYQTHWPDPDLPIDQTLAGLERVVRAGKVRYVGCSNENAYGLTRALGVSRYEGLPRFETIQNSYSLLNRRFEDELANVCRRESVSLLPYSPIGGGVLSGKYQNGFPEGARFSNYRTGSKRGEAMTRRFVNDKTLATTASVLALADQHGVSPVSLAVAFTLSREYVGSTIIGATRVEQLAPALSGAELTLDAGALDAIDELSKEILYPMG